MFKVPDHPFYRPLWRRIAIVAVSGIWAALEIFGSGNVMWMMIASAFFLYALYVFLIAWKDPPPES
jgi:hypothetical protein